MSTQKPEAKPLDQDLYDWIFVDKKIFSLELYVDRVGRKGFAELQAGRTMKIPFDLTDKPQIAESEAITVVGATLGNCCSHGQVTSVVIKHFEIFTE